VHSLPAVRPRPPRWPAAARDDSRTRLAGCRAASYLAAVLWKRKGTHVPFILMVPTGDAVTTRRRESTKRGPCDPPPGDLPFERAVVVDDWVEIDSSATAGSRFSISAVWCEGILDTNAVVMGAADLQTWSARRR